MSDPSFSTKEETQSQEWQGLRFPSYPGCSPLPEEGERVLLRSWDGGSSWGKAQPLMVQSRGKNQPPPPLPSLEV